MRVLSPIPLVLAPRPVWNGAAPEIVCPRTPPGVGKRQGRPVSLLCSRNAAHGDEDRMWMVVAVSALDKPHGPVVFWLRKLGPSRTMSERTFEHCVSPSPPATITTAPCNHRKSQRRNIHILWMEREELERNSIKRGG